MTCFHASSVPSMAASRIRKGRGSFPASKAFSSLSACLILACAVATPALAQLTVFPDAVLTYPGCGNMQASDFVAVELVRRGSGGTLDANTNEPLKMAFDMDAQGKVDVYFVQRHGMVRKYSAAAGTTVTLANFGFSTGTSLTDSTQICVGCASNGNTFNSSEGLQAIALDPGFKSNGWVYLYVQIKTIRRVTRYKLTGNTLDLNSGKTIWSTTTPYTSQHMGGALRFDKAGNLWISIAGNGSTGNTTTPYAPDLRYLSANTNSPFGKILRIKPVPLPDNQPAPAAGVGTTYTIPSGNLRNQFFQIGGRISQDTAKILPEIYVMGTRNAYTMSIDSVRNAVTWGDVGPDQFPNNSTTPAQQSEEFNFTTTPGNFGYPYWVGATNGGITLNNAPPPSGSTPAAPVHTFTSATVAHTGIDTLPPARTAIAPYGKACAVTGPVYYYNPSLASNVKFPPHFHGAWFVGDFNRSWIDALTLNAEGTAVTSRMKVFTATGSAVATGYLSTIATTSLATSNSFLEMEMGPDGALYVMHYGGYRTNSAASGIFRIEYRGSCRPSTISIAFHRERSGTQLARLDGSVLRIAGTGAHRVEVRALSGRLLWSRSGSGKADYNLKAVSAGASGIHVVTVTAPGERFARKLML
jgi:cytochrome c